MKILICLLFLMSCKEKYYLVSTACTDKCVIIIAETNKYHMNRDTIQERWGFDKFTPHYYFIQTKGGIIILLDSTDWQEKLKWFPR